jgi:hypothetical protein
MSIDVSLVATRALTDYTSIKTKGRSVVFSRIDVEHAAERHEEILEA